MLRVLVTGCSGFVGGHVCARLAEAGFRVRGAIRNGRQVPTGCSESVVVGAIDGTTRWAAALEGVDCVVHLAAKAHITGRLWRKSKEYMTTNANGTEALAVAAASMGVKRLVYISSAKVNGNRTSGRPFRGDDVVRPAGPYGVSKWLGEKGVRAVSERSHMEAAVVRLPLVYGPGVKANFLALLKSVDREVPLPFGAVRNSRSLLASANLADFICVLLQHPGDVRGTWMVSDGVDLSTPDLIRLIALAMNRRARLIDVPPRILRILGTATILGSAMERLCGSFVVDITDTCRYFGWSPPFPVRSAIERTVSAYLRAKSP